MQGISAEVLHITKTIITIDFTVHVHLSHEQSRCHKEGVNQLMLHCNTLSC